MKHRFLFYDSFTCLNAVECWDTESDTESITVEHEVTEPTEEVDEPVAPDPIAPEPVANQHLNGRVLGGLLMLHYRGLE